MFLIKVLCPFITLAFGLSWILWKLPYDDLTFYARWISVSDISGTSECLSLRFIFSAASSLHSCHVSSSSSLLLFSVILTAHSDNRVTVADGLSIKDEDPPRSDGVPDTQSHAFSPKQAGKTAEDWFLCPARHTVSATDSVFEQTQRLTVRQLWHMQPGWYWEPWVWMSVILDDSWIAFWLAIAAQQQHVHHWRHTVLTRKSNVNICSFMESK